MTTILTKDPKKAAQVVNDIMKDIDSSTFSDALVSIANEIVTRLAEHTIPEEMAPNSRFVKIFSRDSAVGDEFVDRTVKVLEIHFDEGSLTVEKDKEKCQLGSIADEMQENASHLWGLVKQYSGNPDLKKYQERFAERAGTQEYWATVIRKRL